MKVYIITRVGFPNGMAPTKRIKNYATALYHEGVDCEVVIYTRTEVYGQTPKNTIGEGIIDNIQFKYIKGTPLRESNVFSRKINDYLDRLRLLKYLKKNLRKNDIVFVYNHCDSFSKKIIKIAHRLGAKYIHELCELPFGTSTETPQLIKKRKKWQKNVMPKFDGCIAISEELEKYASEYCSKGCKIAKIPILVNFNEYRLDNQSDKSIDRYVFHSGGLQRQKDGFPEMLEAFGKATMNLPSDIKFLITGNPSSSSHKIEINDIIKNYNLQNRVVFLGFLSDEELRDRLSKASLVIINKLSTTQNRYCFPTKLGEYMAAAKPIIITSFGESAKWLENKKNAIIIEPDNVDLLAETIISAFKHPDELLKIGMQAQIDCKSYFSIEANSKKIKHFFESI